MVAAAMGVYLAAVDKALAKRAVVGQRVAMQEGGGMAAEAREVGVTAGVKVVEG